MVFLYIFLILIIETLKNENELPQVKSFEIIENLNSPPKSNKQYFN